MKEAERAIEEIRKVLQAKLEEANRKLEESPEGELRICRSRGKDHFVHKLKRSGKTVRKYIRDNDKAFIRALGEKAYYEKIRSLCLEKLFLLEKDAAEISGDIETEALGMLDEGSRVVMMEVLAGKKTAAEEWQNEEYTPNPYRPEKLIYPTLRGECVRSKGERGIVDELFREGIPYKLEYPLEIYGETIYSDIIVLRLSDFSEIRWEHSGMLEKDKYIGTNYDRIAKYASVGILIGQELIITGETKEKPLASQTIKKIIDVYCR